VIDRLEPGLNVLIGDNDTGKSTILLALDLALRASVSRVQTVGLESLFNRDAVSAIMAEQAPSFAQLPILEVDLYLEGIDAHNYYGRHNSAGDDAFGVCLICRPKDELKDAIDEIISGPDAAFPFEYYSIEFKTFAGEPLFPQKKPLDHLLIDNTKISNDYAARAYVRDVYRAHAKETEQSLLQIKYRQSKESFADEQFETLNDGLEDGTTFALKSNSKANLESDLTLRRQDVEIENLGMGMQCFIRTSFALSKQSNIDVVLLEEPENHLSQSNMKKLIDEISSATNSQVFVATHNSYICSRLDLRRAIFFGSPSVPPVRLDDVSEGTAKFFMKAPHNSLLDFILAPKSVLVEGYAEYMLINPMFKNVAGADLEERGVTVISVGGVSFKRYLDVAAILKNKVAVVTDNDRKPTSGRIVSYEAYAEGGHVGVFFDPDADRSTFEICVYEDNKELCETLFSKARKSLTVLEYMLDNKSEAAFQLARTFADTVVAPNYIKDAILWISD